MLCVVHILYLITAIPKRHLFTCCNGAVIPQITLRLWNSKFVGNRPLYQVFLFEGMAEGGGSVLEGFLCPVCKADFGAAVKLLAHFEKEHNEDKDVLQAFKGKHVTPLLLFVLKFALTEYQFF